MKKLISFILALSLMICAVPSGAAASADATKAAETLYELGLFRGTGTNKDGTPIFDLDKIPTRNQAVIMLVRLLGKEDEALAGTWEIPFTDVAKNSTVYPYIGYAYANGLTNGTSAATYSGTAPIKANQYITFVLRSLGYVSGEDFQVSTAWEFSDAIGLTDGQYDAAATKFTRADIAKISCAALSVCIRGTEQTLLENLVEQGAVSAGRALLSGLLPGMETKEFFVTPDQNGEYEISLEGIKRLFPEVESFSCEMLYDQCSDIEGHLASSRQMAFLVASGGIKGDRFTEVIYSFEELTGDIRLLLFSEKTRLCGFFNGIPEEKDGKFTLRVTRCDYEFSELYEQQKEKFEKIDIPYVDPDQISDSGAMFVMRGYHASVWANMDTQLDKGRDLYMMWSHLPTSVPGTDGMLSGGWYQAYPIGLFSNLRQLGREDFCRYFLLLDEAKNPIGYTLA